MSSKISSTGVGASVETAEIANGAVTDAKLALTAPVLGAPTATTIQTSGNVGIAVAPSATSGVLLLAREDGNKTTVVITQNADAAAANAAAAARVTADTSTIQTVAYGTGFTVGALGLASLAGYTSLNSTVGNGIAIGPTGAKPLLFSTNNQMREFFSGTTKTLTESSATGIVDIAVANNTVIGCTLFYTIQANDASDYQVLHGQIPIGAVSKAGTITANVGTAVELSVVSAGTLTNTVTVTTGAAKITLNLNAVSSLTQTTLRASYHLILSGGAGTVTVL